jgi:pimeloyl-ACP methyl ester carboxylesterase
MSRWCRFRTSRPIRCVTSSQVTKYAKHFTCITVDPRGAGQTDKPEGTYTTELFADDVAAVMQ